MAIIAGNEMIPGHRIPGRRPGPLTKNLSALLLCLSLSALDANAAEIHLDDPVAAIPPGITDVYRCGQWKWDGSEGDYRVLYFDFHYGNSLLYIQWIKSPRLSDGERELVYTLSVPEFNANDHIELSFAKPRCIATRDGIRFVIHAWSGHEEKTRRFDLRLFQQPGQYRMRPGT